MKPPRQSPWQGQDSIHVLGAIKYSEFWGKAQRPIGAQTFAGIKDLADLQVEFSYPASCRPGSFTQANLG